MSNDLSTGTRVGMDIMQIIIVSAEEDHLAPIGLGLHHLATALNQIVDIKKLGSDFEVARFKA